MVGEAHVGHRTHGGGSIDGPCVCVQREELKSEKERCCGGGVLFWGVCEEARL